jgi:murein DD-endopeptidase MepM/ murein hydrolase activator NlpD
MIKEILSEIQRMKFLVGYSKGRVISEQTTPTPSSSLGEKDQDTDNLEYHLENDLLRNWKWFPEEDFEDENDVSYYAIISKKGFTTKKLYLSDEGVYYKIEKDQKIPVGEWYFKKNYPKNTYNFYLEPYKTEKTKPNVTTQDVTTQDETPVTNTNDTPQPNTTSVEQGGSTQDITTNNQNVQANDKLDLRITVDEDPELTKLFEENKGKLTNPLPGSSTIIKFAVPYTMPGTQAQTKQDFITLYNPDENAKVFAAFAGIIVSIKKAPENPDLQSVTIKHGDYFTTYSPVLTNFSNISQGQKVTSGQEIGWMPSEVGVRKPGELDFILTKGSQFLNPEDWIKK